jgi:hypothetical protein
MAQGPPQNLWPTRGRDYVEVEEAFDCVEVGLYRLLLGGESKAQIVRSSDGQVSRKILDTGEFLSGGCLPIHSLIGQLRAGT